MTEPPLPFEPRGSASPVSRSRLVLILLPTPFLATATIVIVLLLIARSAPMLASSEESRRTIMAAMLGAATLASLVGFCISLMWTLSVRDWIQDLGLGEGMCSACDYPVAAVLSAKNAELPIRCPECGSSLWNLGAAPRRLRRLARWSAVVHGIGAAILLIGCGVTAVSLPYALLTR